jgi:hypothetical protein
VCGCLSLSLSVFVSFLRLCVFCSGFVSVSVCFLFVFF